MQKSLFPFTKMHGLGNDFIILENFSGELQPQQIRYMAHRRLGVGCDQVLVLTPSPHAHAHLKIWNADGIPAEACGNGTRCVMGYIAKKNKLSLHTPLTLSTESGLLKGWQSGLTEATVEQGEPSFLLPDPLDLSEWNLGVGWAVSVGNPHLVIFVEQVDRIPLTTLGPLLEYHPAFPHQTNVEFVQVQNSHLRVRVWERGACETPACGTGASAAAFVALSQKYLLGPEVTVTLDGGQLFISWILGKPLIQRGPFETVFEGELLGTWPSS